MRAFRPLTAFQRHLMIALFACAVLVRMAVPEGWMPVTDASGAVRITICTGMGPVDAGMAAAADHAGMNMGHAGMDHAGAAIPGATHDQPSPYDQGSHPCTFAGLGLAAALPDLALAPTVPFIVAQPRALVRAAVAIGHGLAAPPPPPTGPPLLA
ncbi:hypothetical protein [Hephaestia caeni]|nr:hypothetical protein [Hephaestia caeni]